MTRAVRAVYRGVDGQTGSGLEPSTDTQPSEIMHPFVDFGDPASCTGVAVIRLHARQCGQTMPVVRAEQQSARQRSRMRGRGMIMRSG